MPTYATKLRRLLLVATLVVAGCSSNDPAALVSSAKSYLDKSDAKAAAIQLKNALQQTPDNAEARFLLARALLDMGDAAGAESEARKALKLNYAPDEVQPVLARAVLAQGAARRVTTEFGSVALRDPKARASLATTLAMANLALGNLQAAKDAMREAASQQPDDPEVLLAQARIAAAGNDQAAALHFADLALGRRPGDAEASLFKAQLLNVQGKRDEAIKLLEGAIDGHSTAVALRVALVPMLLVSKRVDDAGAQVAKLRERAPNDPRTLYADALWSFTKGDAAHARDVLQRVLSANPEHLPSLMLNGLVQFQLGSYASAEDSLRKVLARVPDDPGARRSLAATYIRTGRAPLALETLDPLLRADVPDAATWRTAGEAALATGNPSLASRYYERAIALDKDNVGAQVRLAQVRLATGDAERAFHDLAELSASDTGETQADLAIIAGHLQRHETDQALAASDALLKKQPDKPLTYTVRGSIYLAKRDFANARASFDKALSLDPKNFTASYNLALIDLREGKPEVARSRYDAMLAKDPGNEQLLLADADLARVAGRGPEEPRKLLEKAIEAHPGSVAPRLALIQLLGTQGNAKDALAVAEAAQTAIPNNTQISNALGGAQLRAGNANQAVATFQRIAQARPQDSTALLRLAEAQASSQDASGAIVTARKAIALAPNDPSSWLLLTKLMLSSGHPEDALAEARKLQKEQPDRAFGYALEGEILAAQRKWGEAAAAYQKVYARAPVASAAARTYVLLGLAGNAAGAAQFADKWNGEHPKDVTLRVMAAQASQLRKDNPRAIAQYRAVLDVDPDNVQALNNLAWMLQQSKDPGAREYAERAYRLVPLNADVLDTLGLTLLGTSESARGVQLLRMASNLAPTNNEIRLHLAQALAGSGDKPGARREVEPLLKLDPSVSSRVEAEKLLSTL